MYEYFNTKRLFEMGNIEIEIIENDWCHSLLLHSLVHKIHLYCLMFNTFKIHIKSTEKAKRKKRSEKARL